MVRDAVRLYFVHVPENKYFLKILFFLNKNIFKCLVVFKKIFLSVDCYAVYVFENSFLECFSHFIGKQTYIITENQNI